jgi:DNA mismatch endonuclease (patch repair protein)
MCGTLQTSEPTSGNSMLQDAHSIDCSITSQSWRTFKFEQRRNKRRPARTILLVTSGSMERPVPSSDVASRRMRAQPSWNTKVEVAIRSELHRRGLRFFVHRRPLGYLRRQADITFPQRRVAVFVDGCFWHGCPRHGTWPQENEVFWRDKILGNRRRDAETVHLLEEAGWTVVRIWEHEDPEVAADHVEQLVRTSRK